MLLPATYQPAPFAVLLCLLPLRAVGLGMVPVNIAVGLLSAAISDRSMVAASLLGMLCGLGLLTLATAGAAFYFAGGILLFLGEGGSGMWQQRGGAWTDAVESCAMQHAPSLPSQAFLIRPVQPLHACCTGLHRPVGPIMLADTYGDPMRTAAGSRT